MNWVGILTNQIMRQIQIAVKAKKPYRGGARVTKWHKQNVQDKPVCGHKLTRALSPHKKR